MSAAAVIAASNDASAWPKRAVERELDLQEEFNVQEFGSPAGYRVAKRAALARVRHGTMMAAYLIVVLCFSGLGFLRQETIAQEEQAPAEKPGSTFNECANGCPVMIVIPAGKFMMGSPENESGRDASDRPRHEVTIAKPFAVSKFEVTFAEWDACVAAAACPQVQDHWGRGEMPVINVSWGGAKQYANWLSRLTGKDYRLLTEAEWEYAARAGTASRYSWGDDPGNGNACLDGAR
jgi:sulfatase-modifying factor enzyme 1